MTCSQVVTCGSIQTWVDEAVVYVQLTELSRESWQTEAGESVDLVLASPAVQTGSAGTLIHISLTVVSRVTRRTHTAEPVHQVPAGSSVLALVLAVIDIDVTFLSRPTRNALAEVSTNQVAARVGVDTGLAVAFVGVDEAGLAGPLRRTVTLISMNQILTGPTVVTGVRRALINIEATGGSTPARGTDTLITQTGLNTAPSIRAGLRQTCMLCPLTVDSRVALNTGTLVFVRSRVAAGSPVQTGLFGPTEVQIFVTEMSSPVGIAQTLPWFNTGSMDTARVRITLVTVLPLPAIQTLAVTWLFAVSMFCTAALPTNGCVTF